jgi:hypothetical protein
MTNSDIEADMIKYYHQQSNLEFLKFHLLNECKIYFVTSSKRVETANSAN